MASLGELFVELGVVGDIEPLQKAITKTKQLVAQIDKEIESNKRLAKYLEDLSKARTNSEKKIIKENFANEVQKSKLNEQSKATQNLLNKKKEQLALITKSVAGFVAIATAVGGAIVAISRLTDSLIQNNQAWVNFTNQTDLALSSLQEYAGVAGLLDKSLGAQGAAGTIQNLNDKLFELQLTGEGARGFMLGGINPMGQDAFGVIEQLRDRVKSLNNTSATYLLKQMGLDPKLLPMLRMTREEFEQLAEVQRKYSLNEEQRAQIQKMNIQLGIAQQKLQYLKDKAILAIMPYWIRFMNAVADIAEMLAKVSVSVGKFLKKWGLFIGALLISAGKIKAVTKIFFRLGFAIGGINKPLGLLIRQIPFLGRALAKLALNPTILGLTALAATLYLIADDISHYMNGGGSVIGVIAKGLEDLDLKGAIDFPVPEWLRLLIEAIHWFSNNEKVQARAIERRLQEATGDTDARTIENKDGSYSSADIPPEFQEKMNVISPNLSNTTPQVQKTVNNNRTAMNTANTSNNVTQNIQIQTNQPAESVRNELAHANYVFT